MQDVLSYHLAVSRSTLLPIMPIWKQNFWGEAPLDSTSKPLYLRLKDAESVSKHLNFEWFCCSLNFFVEVEVHESPPNFRFDDLEVLQRWSKSIKIQQNPIQIPKIRRCWSQSQLQFRGSPEISGYPWSLMMAFSQLEAELMEERNHEDHDSPWGPWPTKIWWTAKIAQILKWTTNFCGRSQVAEKQMFKPWLQSLLMPWVIPCSPWISMAKKLVASGG